VSMNSAFQNNTLNSRGNLQETAGWRDFRINPSPSGNNTDANVSAGKIPLTRKPNRLPALTRLEMLAAMDRARLDIAAEIAAARAEWDTTEPYEGWRIAARLEAKP
jgi:hypothetical protein